MEQKAKLEGEGIMPQDLEQLKQLIEELRKLEESMRRNIESAMTLDKRISETLTRIGISSEGPRNLQKEKTYVPRPPAKPVEGSLEKVSVGVEKVNELLTGGVRPGMNALLSGPPFSGKYVLAWNFIAASLDEGVPVVVITTDRDIGEIKYELSRIFRNVDEAEETGLLRFIDLYSRTVQQKPTSKYAAVIDSTSNISSLIKVTEQIGNDIRANYPYYRVVFTSLNVFVAELDDKILVKFLQQFTQKRKMENAVTFFLMEEGQNEKRPSDAISYIFDGMIEFKTDASRNLLRVHGLGNVRSRDWIELYLNETSFDLGSFTLEKIR